MVKEQNIKVLVFLRNQTDMDPYLVDQWKKASMSSLLNLAEGTGRMTDADKRHYLTIARGSIFECVALLDLLKNLNFIPEPLFQEYYNKYEQISKMLLGMFRSYNKQ